MIRSDASAGKVEHQQEKLPISSTAIESTCSSPSSTVDSPNSMSALVSPSERLERELHQARQFLESIHFEEEHAEKAKNEDDDNDDNSFTRHLESANILQRQMEKAKHELMESSLRAQEYLGDLSEGGDCARESSRLPRSRVADRNSKYERDEDYMYTSTAKMDMKLLLADMADLKRELSDAQEEISRLRRDAWAIGTAKSEQYPKTHRRVLSDPTTSATYTYSNSTSIPTIVECLGQERNSQTMALEDDYSGDDFGGIVHRAYVANMRISNGFVDNKWWEGDAFADSDDGGNECGGGACFLGGLADILKGRRKGSQRKDALG